MTGLNYDLSLFSDDTLPAGLSRRTDPETSQKAAQAITGRTEQAILRTFRSQYQAYPSLGVDWGLTDDELAGWHPTVFPPTLKSARSRLKNKGVLVDSGRVRPGNRGMDQTVWILRAP